MLCVCFLLRPLLKQIKNSAEAHIVLDCSTEKIYEVLKQAQQIGMMSDYHSYLVTSLDLHTVNLDEFKYGGTNITGFRLINEKVVEDVVRQWSVDEKGISRPANITTIKVNFYVFDRSFCSFFFVKEFFFVK